MTGGELGMEESGRQVGRRKERNELFSCVIDGSHGQPDYLRTPRLDLF